jgi:hypothetical protein
VKYRSTVEPPPTAPISSSTVMKVRRRFCRTLRDRNEPIPMEVRKRPMVTENWYMESPSR